MALDGLRTSSHPITLQKIIQSIELSGDNEVRSVVIKETNGNSSQIAFSHIAHPTHTTPEQAANFERLLP